jgi:hypothetical protein
VTGNDALRGGFIGDIGHPGEMLRSKEARDFVYRLVAVDEYQRRTALDE